MDSSASLVPVPSVHIGIVWPAIADRVGRACERSFGKFTPDYLRRELVGERMQLWLAWADGEAKAICITRTTEHEAAKALEFIIVTGEDRENWQHLKCEIEAWGRSIGCTIAQAVARPGWRRVFKDMTCSHVLLEKVL